MITIHLDRNPDRVTASLVEAMKRENTAFQYYVVPSQFTVEAEQELMDRLHQSVLFRISVKSFPGLEREIFSKGRGLAETTLTETGRNMLLRLLAEEHSSDWSAFPAEARREGFYSRLSKELKEYKQYGIRPELLEKLGEKSKEASASAEKWKELAQIYRYYEEALDEGLCDGDDRMREAFAQLEEADLFPDTAFYFDAFHSLSKLELDALEALDRRGYPIHIGITLDPILGKAFLEDPEILRSQESYFDRLVEDASVFQLSLHFLSQIVDRAGSSVSLSLEVVSKETGEREGQKEELSRRFFSYQTRPIAAEGEIPVELKRYRNTEREMEGVAIAIQRLVQEEGVRYSQIRLVLMDPEEYQEPLRRIFSKEKIPFFYDSVRGVDFHPMIRFLLGALSLAEGGFRLENVCHLLKSGLFPADEADIESYEHFLRRRKIHHGMFFEDRYFQLDENFAALFPHRAAAWREEYELARCMNRKLLHLLEGFPLQKDRSYLLKDFAKALYSLLAQEEIQQAMDRFRAKLLQREDRERLEEDRQLWDHFVDLLEEMVLIGGDRAFALEDLCAMAREGLSNLRLGIIPPYRDQVLVSTLTRSRARVRDYVFLVGMNDTVLPSSPKEDGLLSREEKQLFREEDIFLPSMRDFRMQEETFNFYTVISSFRKRLFLTTAMQSSSNESMEPSPWLSRFQQLYLPGRLPVQSVRDFSYEDYLYTPALLGPSLAQGIREEDPEAKELLQQLREAPSLNEETQQMLEAVTQALAYENHRENLPENLVEGLYGRGGYLSASQLEQFFVCPYAYFLTYGLGVDREESYEVDSLDLGNLIHSSIDQWTGYFAEALEQGSFPDFAKSREEILRSFHDQVPRTLDAVRRSDRGNAFVLDLARHTILEAHQVLYRLSASTKSGRIYHELGFGPHQALQGMRLATDPVSGEDWRLRGRIDRLDQVTLGETNYLQVVDYKTGVRTFDLTSLLGGLNLQLPLYLEAVSSQWEAIAFGFFYLSFVPRSKVNIKIHRFEDLAEPDENKVESVEKKEGKLDGVLLADSDALQAFDRDLKPNGKGSFQVDSQIYSFAGRKKDVLNMDNVLSRGQMTLLLERAKCRAEEAITLRQTGRIALAPYRTAQGKTGCDYCAFHAICRFEKISQYGDYRIIDSLTWQDLAEKEGEADE